MPLLSLQTSNCSAFDSPPVQEQQRIPEDRPNRKASSPKIWVVETTQVVMVVMIDGVNDKLLMIIDCWWLNYWWWCWWEGGNPLEWRLFHVAQFGIHTSDAIEDVSNWSDECRPGNFLLDFAYWLGWNGTHNAICDWLASQQLYQTCRMKPATVSTVQTFFIQFPWRALIVKLPFHTLHQTSLSDTFIWQEGNMAVPKRRMVISLRILFYLRTILTNNAKPSTCVTPCAYLQQKHTKPPSNWHVPWKGTTF